MRGQRRRPLPSSRPSGSSSRWAAAAIATQPTATVHPSRQPLFTQPVSRCAPSPQPLCTHPATPAPPQVEANARAEAEALHEQHALLLGTMQAQLAQQRDRERQAVEEEMSARSKVLAGQLVRRFRLEPSTIRPAHPATHAPEHGPIVKQAQLKQLHATEMADMKASMAATIDDYEQATRRIGAVITPAFPFRDHSGFPSPPDHFPRTPTCSRALGGGLIGASHPPSPRLAEP